MNFIACVILISLLCKADFNQSKTINHGEKDGKGISSTGLNHIEHYWNISDDLAERRSLKQLLTKQRVEWLLLSHSGQSIKVRALPYSRGFAKFIPDEEEKMKYLISEMGLRRSVVNTLLDKDLIVSPTFRTAFFYDPVYGSFKAIKLFDHQSISEILKNKVTDFENQSFKAWGVRPVDPVYKNNGLTLQRGHMIGAKLFAENEDAYWFSYNFLNVVPMYRAFNGPIFYHKMEKQFLNFAQEVNSPGVRVCFTVSFSPDTRYDKQTGRGIPTEKSWLENKYGRINIPQSVSVIAFSLSNTGRVGEVFAFVGNNDMLSPEWYFPQDLSELQNYYRQDGDLTSTLGIRLLKTVGYKMWHPKLKGKGKRLI